MVDLEQRVSVIIPTYQRQFRYLVRAIKSIKNQTYNNIEIIIVDDNPPGSRYRGEIQKFMKQYEDNSNIEALIRALEILLHS